MTDGFTKKQTITHINIVLDSGGAGDLIARLPAVAYLYKHFPHLILHIWTSNFGLELIMRSLPDDPKRLIIRTFDKGKKYNNSLPTRTFSYTTYTNLSAHMTSHAFHQLVNIDPKPEDMNYLTPKLDDIDLSKFNLPEKYVVMPLGFTSNVREFLPQNANPVIDYIKSKGYEVVFLGSSVKSERVEEVVCGHFREDIHWHKGINLINKTTLCEAVKIVHGAKTLVGVDCGMLHIAATHPTMPIVGAFTTVHSSARLPYRHNIKGFNYHAIDIPKEKLACINCQSRLVMSFNHSFLQCFEDPDARMGDIKCLSLLTPDLFINELEKIL